MAKGRTMHKSFDATDVRVVRRFADGLQLRFDSPGTGYLLARFGDLEMSDILSDAGVADASSSVTVRLSPWRPHKRLSRPYVIPAENETTVLAGSLGGPEAILAIDVEPRGDEGPFEHWEIGLGGPTFIKLIQIAVDAVGHPWFDELRNSPAHLAAVDRFMRRALHRAGDEEDSRSSDSDS